MTAGPPPGGWRGCAAASPARTSWCSGTPTSRSTSPRPACGSSTRGRRRTAGGSRTAPSASWRSTPAASSKPASSPSPDHRPRAPRNHRTRKGRAPANPARAPPAQSEADYLLSPPVLVVFLAVARTLLGGLRGRLGAVGRPGLRLGLRGRHLGGLVGGYGRLGRLHLSGTTRVAVASRLGGDGRLGGRRRRRGGHGGLAEPARHLPAEQLADLRQVGGDAVLLPGQLVDLALGGDRKSTRLNSSHPSI